MENKTIEYAPQNFNDQFEEEKRKHDLSNKSDDWKVAIEEAEDLPCLEGRIKFLLDYAKSDLDKFKICAENAKTLLDNLDNKKDHLFERLLMNVPDSSYPCHLEDMADSPKLKVFGIEKLEQFTFSNKGKGDRDFGWHRLLNDNPDNYQDPRKDSLTECQKAARGILGTPHITPPINIKLNKIEEWKKLLIDCPALIEYCTGTIIYKVTYNNKAVVYYLSTGKPKQLFGKKNKISELYTRYVYEMLGGESSGWTYVEWTYKDDCKEIIDSFLKKGDIKIRHNAVGWSIEGLNINTTKSLKDIIESLKTIPQQTP